jgi:hypothetical protein
MADTHQNLTPLTEKQRSEALQRKACVDRLRNLRMRSSIPLQDAEPVLLNQLQRDFPDLRISRSTVRNWDRLLRHPDDLASLVDRRRGSRVVPASAEAWNLFRKLFLNKKLPSIHRCWQQVSRAAIANVWQWCDYRDCRRHLNLHISPRELSRYRPARILRRKTNRSSPRGAVGTELHGEVELASPRV